MKRRIVIMGAAGRDFHNFNTCFRDDPATEVVAFTATQIPGIEERTYPPILAGPLYPEGIPIYPESELPAIIRREGVSGVVFAYSDVALSYVMEEASLCLSLGCDFTLLGPERTMISSVKPVISVTATRTGCGKSGVSRFISRVIEAAGRKPVTIRHPMPYGDLEAQRVQRFSSIDDLERHNCTIEEREEYEPVVEAGGVVYSGVDYELILREAEEEADIIIWDGGNNDFPFIKPDLSIVLVDPLRPGDEAAYYPGRTNLLMADTVVINKAESAAPEDIDVVLDNISKLNPVAGIIETRSNVMVEDGASLMGKTVLVIEDGPTLTHGGMGFGAGIKAAELSGAHEVDPRPYAVGSIKETFAKYPNIGYLVPAMGYSKDQVRELEATINLTPCDCVLVATPVDLRKIIEIKKPAFRVRYEVEDMEEHGLEWTVTNFINERFG